MKFIWPPFLSVNIYNLKLFNLKGGQMTNNCEFHDVILLANLLK